MLTYSVASFLSIFFAFILKNKRVWSGFFLSCLPLLLVAALRQFVGTDYTSYYYNKIPIILNNPIQLEFGFSLLAYFSVKVLGDYQWLIAVMACITCLCYWSFMFRYSKNVPLSILIFMAMGCYYFSLNAMRQSVAIAVFLFSLKYVEKRKIGPFLLCIFVGFSFHTSALLYIPFYWLVRVRVTNRLVIFVSFFLYVIYPVFSMVLYPIILGKYASYFEWGAKSGFNWRYLLPLLGVILLDFRMNMEKKVQENPSNDKINILRNLTIFSFWACNLAPTLTGASASRVILFFLPAVAAYFPCLLNDMRKLKLIVSACFLVIFFWTTNEGLGGILPYHSVFSDYKITYRDYIYNIYHSDVVKFKD